MQRWITFWELASNFGCQPAHAPPERKRIRLTNQSCIVLALLIIVFACVFGYQGQPLLGGITWGVALIFAAIPFLQKMTRGAPVSRYFFLLTSYISIFVYSLLVGRDSGIQFFFISAIATPFVLLDTKSKKAMILLCMIPLVFLFALELHFHEAVTPLAFSAKARRIMYLMMLPSAALTTFLYSGYFYLINQISERELYHSLQDVSRSKKLIEDQQAQLASASRLSAIGELSGSIAHEINNPLSIILGYTELIQRQLRSEAPDRARIAENCEKILKTLHRINRIVLGLRKLSRQNTDDPVEHANIRDIIEDATSVCSESLVNLGITLRLKIPEEPCYCLCRPLQLSQVLLNLIQNSKDAVQPLEIRWIEIEVRPLDTALTILVKDSGMIRDPEILDRIGQPFFTTKPVGKGTGLGLSIARKILASHGGTIGIDKEASSTTFVMQLPRQVQTS